MISAISLDRFHGLGSQLDHPEAVVWDPVRESLWAGGEAGQLYRVELDGAVEQVASTGGFLLGLALDGAGCIYACDAGRAAVLRIDPDTGEVVEYSRGSDARAMTAPNYLCFDPEGNLYVTDSGIWAKNDGAVFRIAPGGAAALWAESAPRFPNGCCLTPDRRAIVVVESLGHCVTRITIDGCGRAGRALQEVALTGTVPDGVAYAEDGTLYVSCYRPDRIYAVESGRAEVIADDPYGITLSMPTNLAFAGSDLDILAVANLGGYHIAISEIGARGLPLERPHLP